MRDPTELPPGLLAPLMADARQASLEAAGRMADREELLVALSAAGHWARTGAQPDRLLLPHGPHRAQLRQVAERMALVAAAVSVPLFEDWLDTLLMDADRQWASAHGLATEPSD